MGASSLLGDLPSRGLLTDTQGLSVSRPPPHVCDYDTAPPPEQVITTDPVNILIRALMSRRAIREAQQKGSGKDHKGKRPAASMDDNTTNASAKRERRDHAGPESRGSERGDSRASHGGGGSSGSSHKISKAELEGYTVDRLRTFLKERGLPMRGRKEELLTRAKRLLGYK